MPRRKKSPSKRSLFRELMAGVDAMREHRKGRLALRTQDAKPITPRELGPSSRRADSGKLRP
jgi:hypothetical protein